MTTDLKNKLATRKADSVAHQAEVEDRPLTIDEMLRDPVQLGEIAKALPKSWDTERFIRIALTHIKTSTKLPDCDARSIIGGVLLAAQLGLELGSALGEAYLIPFKGQAQLVLGYKGIRKLAWQSGDIASIEVRTVHQNDDFEIDYGLNQKLEHHPVIDGPSGPSRCWYGIARFTNGGYYYLMLTKDGVEYRRGFSKQPNSKAWTESYDAMAMKGLAVDTPIPTPNGWTDMGNLSVGDRVFDKNGKPTDVVAVSDIKNVDCYRVTFSDGDSITCDDEHLWWAAIPPGGRKGKKPGVLRRDMSVHPIADLYDAKRAGLRVTVPVAGALELNPIEDLPVHPYLLGLWLGDGNSWFPSISLHADDLDAIVANVRATGAEIGTARRLPKGNGAVVSVLGMQGRFAELGVIRNKHVPTQYLRGSFGQRLDLLRGLMDSDGSATKRNRAIFSNTDIGLADAVAELACSLGEIVTRRSYVATGFGVTVLAHTVAWTPAICPFNLPRKGNRVSGRMVAPYRGVKSVDKIESVPTRCIAVDSPTESYLAGERMVPTHNSTLLAMAPMLPLSTAAAYAISRDETVVTDIVSDIIDLPFTAVVEKSDEILIPPEDTDEVEASASSEPSCEECGAVGGHKDDCSLRPM